MAQVTKLGRELRLNATIERYDIVESGAGTADGIGRGIDVLKARLSFVQSGQHVDYTLRVVYDGGESWTLRKRFNEVAALHDILKRRLHSVPDLPAKSAVRQFSYEYLEGRRADLSTYLQELCKRRDVLNCREAQEFFGIPEHVPQFGQAQHTSEPALAAEVHEAAFGIADFAYDPAQGLLVLGATDFSWTSRIDTKITNIKLPWEPAAPNLPTSQMSLWRQSVADLRFEMKFTCRYTATISCVALTRSSGKGLCLCGLSDGTVGCHSIKVEDDVVTVMTKAPTTLGLLRHTAAIVALAVDDAEQWIVTASKDTALKVYDLRRQMIQCEAQTPAPTTAMTYCQEQKRLFTGLQTGRTVLWDTSVFPIVQLANIPDSATEAVASMRIAALVYDMHTRTLFSAMKDSFVLWAVKTSSQGNWGRKSGQITSVRNLPTAVAWMASSRELLAGFSNGAIVIFDIEKGEASYAMQAHKDEVTMMMWLDAPRRLLTASKDKTLKIWDFRRGSAQRR